MSHNLDSMIEINYIFIYLQKMTAYFYKLQTSHYNIIMNIFWLEDASDDAMSTFLFSNIYTVDTKVNNNDNY